MLRRGDEQGVEDACAGVARSPRSRRNVISANEIRPIKSLSRWPRTITSSSAPSLTTREIEVSHSSTSRVAISEGGEAL